MSSPRLNVVTCSSPVGVHRMAYHEWGAPDNPDVVLCVHGLTRTGRDAQAVTVPRACPWKSTGTKGAPWRL